MKLRQTILLAVAVLSISLAATVATGMSVSSPSTGVTSESVSTLAALSPATPEAGGPERATSRSEGGAMVPVLAVLAVIAAGPFVRKALRP